MKRTDLRTRFFSKVRKTVNCWKWIGQLTYKGYGTIHVGAGQHMKSAHRVVYELLREKIPAGLVIDHLCRNRACVNPAHMEVVTPGENTLRGDSPPARNKRKTHCKNGHEFTPENVYSNKRDGKLCGRICKICVLEYKRQRWKMGLGRWKNYYQSHGKPSRNKVVEML